MQGSSASTSDSVSLTSQGSPIVAAISGPSGDIIPTNAVALSGLGSLDPDDPYNAR